MRWDALDMQLAADCVYLTWQQSSARRLSSDFWYYVIAKEFHKKFIYR